MAAGNQAHRRASLTGRGWILKRAFAAGAAADTNIAITGIKVVDLLVSVFELQPPTAGSGDAIVADRTAITSITSDGNIQVAGQATTGNQLDVWYFTRA